MLFKYNIESILMKNVDWNWS